MRFAVWAPNASYVSVVGDFNDWDPAADPLSPVDCHRHLGGDRRRAHPIGQRYKFHLDGREKADPLAFEAEVPPKTASVVFQSGARLAGRGLDRRGGARRSRSTSR